MKNRLSNHQKSFLYQASISCIALTMLGVRFFFNQNLEFAFLLWNLFLAWIPFLISLNLEKLNLAQNKLKTSFFLALWLLFLPNAPYLLTDIIHLKLRPPIPLWYDLSMLVLFGLHGLSLALVSLLKVKKLILQRLPNHISEFIILVILFLTSYGIYLGRFLRWNSWDVVTRPKMIIYTLLDHMFSFRGWFSPAGIIIFAFFGFLTINYYLLKLFNKLGMDKN